MNPYVILFGVLNQVVHLYSLQEMQGSNFGIMNPYVILFGILNQVVH